MTKAVSDYFEIWSVTKYKVHAIFCNSNLMCCISKNIIL